MTEIKLSVAEVLAEARKTLNDFKKKICRGCTQKKVLVQSGYCEECWKERYEAKLAANKEKRFNDNGYVRVYNDENELVYEHIVVMEKTLGRKLTKREAVVWRDGIRSNNDPSNLMLGYKNVAKEELICLHCGTVGSIALDLQVVEQLEPPL